MRVAGVETRVLVSGAGGFIGHHLTKYLAERGFGYAERISNIPNMKAVPQTKLKFWISGGETTACKLRAILTWFTIWRRT
jgi:nucleoside-diphosphate-sugar epimerase